MIRSMTGFGVASTEVDGARYSLEIRSLNNRYFKVLMRVPDEFQGLEAELEPALARRLNRGSVIAALHYSDTSAAAAAKININALRAYIEQIREAAGGGEGTAIDPASMLALPGVVIDDVSEEMLDRVRPIVLPLVEEACDRVLAMRAREGTTLQKHLDKICAGIAERLESIAERAPRVVEQYQTRLQERINTLLAESGTAIRDEDLMREVAVYAERSDIAEEITRLKGHLEQFAEIVEADHDEPAGRTLDFISQEMLREANTIASKCLDVDISRHIVEIKGAIDRIKEQVQNVE